MASFRSNKFRKCSLHHGLDLLHVFHFRVGSGNNLIGSIGIQQEVEGVLVCAYSVVDFLLVHDYGPSGL